MRNMPPRLIGYSVLQDQRDGNTIYLGTNLGVYRSTDRAASWAPLSARKPTPPAPVRRRPTSRGKARRTIQPSHTIPSGTVAANATRPQSTAKPPDDLVRLAQEALERAGYEIGVPDGQLGPRTIAAIKRFQTDRYLAVTAQLDETTILALGVSSRAGATSAEHVGTLSDPINALVSLPSQTGASQILAATNGGLYRTSDPMLGWDRVPYGRGLDARTSCISTSAQDPSMILVGTATTG